MSMTVQIAMKGITDLEILLTALHEMGIKTLLPKAGPQNRTNDVLAYADIQAKRVKFVRRRGGEINMVGDSDWRIFRDDGFQHQLRQQYSLEAVKKRWSSCATAWHRSKHSKTAPSNWWPGPGGNPMDRKEIHFIIDREGNIQSTIQGVKGTACNSLAAEFKDLGQVVEQQPTNEFYETGNRSKLSLDLIHKG